ncbi:hypothetical protein C6P98_23765 [Burkholderia multivorans]|uniref:Uncharacterized protein n=1 Tax=Burkholderia multivorans TaxID=87883 RepID=A0A8E2RVD6_9BURK|nr:hypothetical protein C6P98_23765 [Burkholderia multivorans]
MCLGACLPACLLACLPACLLACLPACLLACLRQHHRASKSRRSFLFARPRAAQCIPSTPRHTST